MKRYPSYKYSGFEWVGEIPNHWNVRKLKYLVRLRNEKSQADSVPTIALENIESNTGRLIRTVEKMPADGELKKFYKDDILFNKLRPYLAKVVQASYEGRCVGELLVLIPEKLSSRFLFYRTISPMFISEINSSTFGSKMPRASWSNFISQMSIPFPNKNEQKVIVNYLDEKTSQIDETIQKKHRLIELLQEERIALVDLAVTGGLDNTVPLKSCRMGWLGNVPKHWDIKRLKHVVNKIGSGVTPRGGAEAYKTSGIPLLRSQNIHFDGLRLDDVVYITQKIHDSMLGSKVQEGDVLLNITGASIGRCYFVEGWLAEANVNQHVCIIRPSHKVMTKYLYEFLSSSLGQMQIDRLQNGANREGLNFEQLKNFVLPIPPISEQKKILSFLDERLNSINTILMNVQHEISLLQEYRRSLVNEVVTGNICIV